MFTHLLEFPLHTDERVGPYPVRLRGNAVCLGLRQRGYAQRTDDDLPAQVREEGIALVQETLEHDYLALVENRLVHDLIN